MSCKINVDELPWETRQKINTELQIKLEENKYSVGAPSRYIYPYEIVGDDIFLPFSYAYRQLKLPRPSRNSFPNISVSFEGELRPEQKVIRKEAIDFISRKGSIMISAFPGFGKCLKKDTPVLMYDGTIKAVQDVQIGEILMGDDSTPREVISTCSGQEQMYNIVPIKGDTFGCNESHILSLKISGNRSIIWDMSRTSYFIRWFDRKKMCFTYKYFKREEDVKVFRDTLEDEDILDIEVKDFLKLSKATKNKLKLYRVPVDFPRREITLDPYFLGLWLGDGSIYGPSFKTDEDEIILYLNILAENLGLKVTCYTDDTSCPTYNIVSHNGEYVENKLLSELQKYNLVRNKHIPYDFKCNDLDTRLSLIAGLIDSAYGYYFKNVYEIFQNNKQLADEICYVARSLGFASFVKPVIKTYNADNKSGVYYLVTIYGSGLEKIPVLLNLKKASPHNQVEDPLVTGFEIVPIEDKDYYGFVIGGNHRFLLGDFTVTHNTCCSINIVSSIGFKTLIIVNKIVLMKQWEESILRFCPKATVQRLTPKSNKKDCDFYIMNAINICKMGKNFFSDIGSVIVDEAHLIMAETLSKSLQYVSPRYLVGLTATPYRPDGLDILLELYFGKYKIVRKLVREHTAYVVNTNFTPTVELARNGKVNWGVILDSQSKDENRNNLIVRIVKHFTSRTFLILVKRVEQGNYLFSKLMENGEHVTSLLGSQQEYDPYARILIGTNSKIGVGFDHPSLDTLLLAGDVEEYFIQYLGRIFRTQEGTPLIFDLVDNNNILKKHFNTRRATYLEHGGTVRNFDLSILQ